MARRGLRLDLRAAFKRAMESRNHSRRDGIAIEVEEGRVQLIDLIVEPLPGRKEDPLFLVLFCDTGPVLNSDEVAHLRHAGAIEPPVEQLEREVRDTRERLQSTIEEYETALEELKSANEGAFLAPTDRRLLVGRDHVHVWRGPRENRARPAIDPLFRSAAVHCSTRVIAVVLIGMLDDGTAGLLAVKNCGGLAIVQEPSDALYPEMPLNAIRHVTVDHVLPVRGMAELLVELTSAPRPPAVEPPEDVRMEAMIPALEIGDTAGRLGVPSPLTCPDCHGTI